MFVSYSLQTANQHIFSLQTANKNILIRSNEMQQYAGVYLLQNHSTCFGCLQHPSSGVRQIVTASFGTGHSVRATPFCQHGLRPRWRKVAAQILRPVPKDAVTLLCTPDDGCKTPETCRLILQ